MVQSSLEHWTHWLAWSRQQEAERHFERDQFPGPGLSFGHRPGWPWSHLKRSEKILKNCLSVDLSLHPLALIWKKSICSYLATGLHKAIRGHWSGRKGTSIPDNSSYTSKRIRTFSSTTHPISSRDRWPWGLQKSRGRWKQFWFYCIRSFKAVLPISQNFN